MGQGIYSVFIGSSKETLDHAKAFALELNRHPFFRATGWWDPSVFKPNESYFESLMRALEIYDCGIFVAAPDDVLLTRGTSQPTVRNNVLLEFGLFAGRLGRERTLLVLHGDPSLPSDLHGISHVRARGDLIDPEVVANVVSECTELLVSARVSEADLLARYLRRTEPRPRDDIYRAARGQLQRRKAEAYKVATLAPRELRELVAKCACADPTTVGQPGHESTLLDFVDLSRLDPSDHQKIAHAYSSFVASLIAAALKHETGSLTIVVERKPTLDESRFLATVLESLDESPVVVDPGSRRVDGRPGDRAIFLHDFTQTGFRPLQCIAELRRRSVLIETVATCFVRQSQKAELMSHFSDNDVHLKTFCELPLR